jgi:tricorn protease
MKKLFSFLVLLTYSFIVFAQTEALWMRYPSISPDGKKIAFGYKGDIYLVNTTGGTATALTIHEAHDMMPVWSKDGKTIAFASDRHGNMDIFTINVNGGAPVRLTFNSANDYPQDFSADNSKVLFTSARNISNTNIRFYSPRLFNNLYTVNVNGGRPILVSGAGVSSAKYNTDNSKIIFQDRKGYEDLLRKHHTSSVTRDIWIYDIAKNTYTQISNFEGEDTEPVFATNGSDAYYLSEKNGSYNIYKSASNNLEQITKYTTHPVRNLSISNNNILCYSYNGKIYLKNNNSEPQQLKVEMQNDGRASVEKNVTVSSNVTEFALSPNGKEIAFVNRGEVFVTSVEGTQTKRITNTPQQERHIAWAPDGRNLLYASERGNSWDIYKANIVRKEEPYFFTSTVINEEAIIANAEEEYQPKYAPNGLDIAYVAERNALKIFNIKSKEIKTLLPLGRNYSYSDGDWDYNWSPDSKNILCDDGEGNWFSSNVALINTKDAAEIMHPLPSGYGQGNVKWQANGQAMSWTNAKAGRKSQAWQGSREVDIYLGFFNKALHEKFNLSKDEYALLKEKEDKEKSEKEKEKKDALASKTKKSKHTVATSSEAKPDSTLVLENFKERINRLTINSSSISDYAITPDASKVYYLAAFEKGFDLWVTEPRTRETKILAKLGAGGSGIEMSKDGKTLFVLKNGSLTKIDDAGKQESIGISSDMILNTEQERRYILDHAYRQVQKKFYDPTLHNLDWKMLHDNYAQFLPHISNNYDYQELLSEFLGELNASHTGGRYSPNIMNGDATACLGLLIDETYNGKGLKVTEVINGGPFYNAKSKLRAGFIIEKIDGMAITDSMDWAQLLNRKAEKNTLITFRDPATPKEMEEVIKPISIGAESGLMYKRWIKKMNEMVTKLSDGKVGYVHVQGMNDGSYRDVFDEAMGANYEKKALIVDTRFNGGGWLHDDLKTFLSGEKYLEFAPQGNKLKDGEPMGRWVKPSCVLMSEGNYSDAFIFPYVYKQAKIGKLIGMPVPGTGTAVWWETQIDPTMVFGIPMVATIGKENRPTENLQVEPDIRVPLNYNDFLTGKDTQLEEAVKEMLRAIK